MTTKEALDTATLYRLKKKAPEASPAWLGLEVIRIAEQIEKRTQILAKQNPQSIAIKQLEAYAEILLSAAGLALQHDLASNNVPVP